MSTAVRAPRRSAPARPAPADRPSRPRLAVVPPPVRPRRTSRARLVIFGALVLFVVLISLAAFQATLVSSRQRLDELERQVAIEQDRFHDLRVDVARLEAPERIQNYARYQLGMVPAGNPIYVTPSPELVAEVEGLAAEHGVDADAGANGTGGSASSWTDVKPYLEPTP